MIARCPCRFVSDLHSELHDCSHVRVACYTHVTAIMHTGPRTILVNCAVGNLVVFLITRPISFHFQHALAFPGKGKTTPALIQTTHGTRKISHLYYGPHWVPDADR